MEMELMESSDLMKTSFYVKQRVFWIKTCFDCNPAH